MEVSFVRNLDQFSRPYCGDIRTPTGDLIRNRGAHRKSLRRALEMQERGNGRCNMPNLNQIIEDLENSPDDDDDDSPTKRETIGSGVGGSGGGDTAYIGMRDEEMRVYGESTGPAGPVTSSGAIYGAEFRTDSGSGKGAVGQVPPPGGVVPGSTVGPHGSPGPHGPPAYNHFTPAVQNQNHIVSQEPPESYSYNGKGMHGSKGEPIGSKGSLDTSKGSLIPMDHSGRNNGSSGSKGGKDKNLWISKTGVTMDFSECPGALAEKGTKKERSLNGKGSLVGTPQKQSPGNGILFVVVCCYCIFDGLLMAFLSLVG